MQRATSQKGKPRVDFTYSLAGAGDAMGTGPTAGETGPLSAQTVRDACVNVRTINWFAPKVESPRLP